MKKVLFLLLIFMIPFIGLVAEEEKAPAEPFESRGFKVGTGILVAAKSPLLAAGADGKFSYNPEFEAKFKKFSIDDWLFGVPVRFDWVFEQKNGFGLGVQLDIDSTFLITGSYSQLTDILKQEIEKAISSFGGNPVEPGEYDLEYGARADLTPMFLLNYKFFRFSVGLGVTMQINGNHTQKAVAALKSGDAAQIQTQLTRIGITSSDPRYTAITNKDTLNSELTNFEKIAYYGLGLDMHLKMNLDFTLGQHFLIGTNFLLRMNSQIALWEKGRDFKENVNTVFDPEQFEGAIGIRLMWIF